MALKRLEGRHLPLPIQQDKKGAEVIETPRLFLRPCREDDKPTFTAILNTPRMMAELGGVRPREAIEALIDRRMADQARYGFSYWAVELRETGELVGTCGLRIADNYSETPVEGMYEAGWRIAEHCWGRGFAREAVEASFAWAWANTPAPRIAAWTTAGNERSWKLMERLGMRRRADLDFIRSGPEVGYQASQMIVYSIERPQDE